MIYVSVYTTIYELLNIKKVIYYLLRLKQEVYYLLFRNPIFACGGLRDCCVLVHFCTTFCSGVLREEKLLLSVMCLF